MDANYSIGFVTEKVPSIESVVKIYLDRGFTVTRDGGVDQWNEQYEPTITFPSGEQITDQQLTVQEVINQSSDAETVLLDFWLDKRTRSGIFLNYRSDIEWGDPRIVISINTLGIDPSPDEPEYSRERIQERIETFLDLVTDVAELTSPEYVYSFLVVGQNPLEGIRPTGRPISEHIEKLPWLSVLSEPIIGDFGGRERVLNAPAWQVEELENGQIMLVKTNHPFDPTEAPALSTDEYLFEGKSRKELEAEATDVDDPFTRLADGDIGVDLIVPRENVDGDLTNDDLELVRCTVQDGILYDLDSGTFHRRIFDAHGDPTGDLPDDVDPADEPYPPLIRLGVPTEFVRLDAPDDETVLTRVIDLDVDVDKIDMLANLAGTAAASDEGLEATQDLVENLHDLDRDGVDGLEDVIEDRIL